jgi:hypothetical protein
MLGMVARKFYNEQKVPLAAVLCSEAWMSVQKTKRDEQPRIEPRHDPNKKECIIITALSLGRKFIRFSTMPVTRDSSNIMHPSGAALAIPGGRNPIVETFYEEYFKPIFEKQRFQSGGG